jgi:hypothetical protein
MDTSQWRPPSFQNPYPGQSSPPGQRAPQPPYPGQHPYPGPSSYPGNYGAPYASSAPPYEQTAASATLAPSFAWLIRHRYLLAYLVAVLVAILGAVQSAPDSDLLTFFIPSARFILAGHPFFMYQVRCHSVAYCGTPADIYPNANPPLAVFLMAPAVAIADKLGWSSNYHYLIGIVTIEFIPVCLLLAHEIDLALRRLAPQLSPAQRYVAFLLALFSPLLWQSMLVWNHVEQPLMLYLMLLGLRLLQDRREEWAGVCFALALYSRTTALLLLFPIFAALLWQRDWQAIVRAGAVLVVVLVMGFAPFLLYDRSDTIYSLATFHGSLGIGGNSIWTLFAGTPLARIARHLDTLAFTGLALILALVVTQRLGITARDRAIYGVLALCALTFPLLNKTNWSYYYLEPFVFLLVWEFSTYSEQQSPLWRAPVITLTYLCLTMTLSAYISLPSVNGIFRRLTGIVEFGLMLSFMLAIWYRARAATATRAAPQPEPQHLPAHRAL